MAAPTEARAFFQLTSVSDVHSLMQTFDILGNEIVALQAALGRFAFADIPAPENLPPWPRSSMDGYAVRAADCFGAGDGQPAYLELARSLDVDSEPGQPLARGTCARVLTGSFLPPECDAVVMEEHCSVAAGTVEIRRSAAPGDNLVEAGEDVASGTVAVAAGEQLDVQRLGLLAALGFTELSCGRIPRVAVLSTGDELVAPGQPVAPGRIRDVNAVTLCALASSRGAQAQYLGIVPDDLAQLTAAVSKACAAYDAVFISGGSSTGPRDFTKAAVLAQAGGEVLVHGIALSPGKPTLIGRVGRVPVLGLPGQVASAFVSMMLFGCPLLSHLAGDRQAFTRKAATTKARLARNVASREGREDYIRVRLVDVQGDLPQAVPVLGKSGLLRTLIASDGWLCVPQTSQGLDAGTLVDVRLWGFVGS